MPGTPIPSGCAPVNNEMSPERGVLRADEFYSYDALMRRLPDDTSRDAIRTLIKEKGLPVHRIGSYRWFHGLEIIMASSRSSTDDEFDE